MNQPKPNCAQRLSQVLADRSINRCSQTRLEQDPLMDGFMRDWRCHEKTKECPRSSAAPRPDCGGINEGNSEQRWSEQVGQVARRLSIPLWQSWDRGQKLPLPLTASAEPVFVTSQNRAMATQTGFPSTCTKGPESSANLRMIGLDHIGTDTDVLEAHFNMATHSLGWMSAGLESFGRVEDSSGNKRGRLHTCHIQGTPLKKMLIIFTIKSNTESPVYAGRIG